MVWLTKTGRFDTLVRRVEEEGEESFKSFLKRNKMRTISLPRALDAQHPSPVSSCAPPLTCAPPPIETPFRAYARLGLNFGDIFRKRLRVTLLGLFIIITVPFWLVWMGLDLFAEAVERLR